jgi:hypothetical protein
MELQSGRSNSGESEALEPIELPVVEGTQSTTASVTDKHGGVSITM